MKEQKEKFKFILKKGAVLIIACAVSLSCFNGCKKRETQYTFAWMSDTQGYSKNVPKIYDTMTEWLKESAKYKNIKFVFHTGDVVNDNIKYQWKNADKAMKTIDGVIPYTVAAGNHDVNQKSAEYNEFVSYFGRNRFKDEDGGYFYKNGMASAKLLNAGSQKYIMTAIGYGADSGAKKWLRDILRQYSDRTAVLTTHDYLNADGSLSENGKDLYENIVLPSKNIHLVLCGHNHGAAINTAKIDDNGDGIPERTVYQMIADYQMTENMGNGFMRLLMINETTKELSVKTYSPYTFKYNCFSEKADEFSVSIKDWFK